MAPVGILESAQKQIAYWVSQDVARRGSESVLSPKELSKNEKSFIVTNLEEECIESEADIG